MVRAVALAMMAALVLGACAGAASGTTPTPSAVPSPTITPSPTVTPSPTPEPACSTKDGKLVSDQLHSVAQRWDDAIHLADQTPRMQLAAQISQLQDIRRDLDDQDWPDCAHAAKTALVDAMNAAIDGFIAFLGEQSDSVVNAKFEDYQRYMSQFTTALDLLR